MPSPLYLLAGPAGCGKTRQLLARYARGLGGLSVGGTDLPVGGTLWLAPTGRSVQDVRERLVSAGLRSTFQPGITTFAGFAEAVLEHAPLRIRPISDGLKRELLHRLVKDFTEKGKLKHFAPIAETDGFQDQLAGFISELKRLEIWPEHFQAACGDSTPPLRGGPPRSGGILYKASDKDRELGELYAAYQNLLVKNQLYDREGRFWEARDLLSKGQTRPFERVKLAVVDGFTDFTRTQHEILTILAGRVDELWISLPLERATARPDLFGKTQRTLDELQRRHPGMTVEWLERKVSGTCTQVPDTLSHIERTIFSNPRDIGPAADTAGVEILAAARQEGEIELLARTIKRLLESSRHTPCAVAQTDDESGGLDKSSHGTRSVPTTIRPHDIVVVFRSLTEAAPLVRATFTELGIPFALESPRPLHEARGLLAQADLLQLAVEDWPFRKLLAVLTNSFFQPDWPEYAGATADDARRIGTAAQRIVRELQVPRGSVRLLERLEKLSLPSEQPASARRDQLQRQASLALPLLRRLKATLDELPSEATPQEWSRALEKLARATGLQSSRHTPCAVTEHGDDTGDGTRSVPATLEQPAWDAFQNALKDSERLSGLLNEPPPHWSQTELLKHIQTILRDEALPEARDETGRVRVLSAQSVRALHVPYLFVAGLAEQAFPPADRDDRLYGESEYRRLIAAGLRLIDRAERNQEEMLLFYEVVTRATRRLYLSYPALDEKAQPLSPSPYLSEIERAFGGKLARPEVGDLNPTAYAHQLLCPSDWRMHAVQTEIRDFTPSPPHPLTDSPSTAVPLLDRRRENPDIVEDLSRRRSSSATRHSPPHPLTPSPPHSLLAGLLQSNSPLADNLGAALCLLQARLSGEGYGPFEGVLSSDAIRQRMAEQYGPDHCWSACQLEEYAACPHEFYLHRVLGLSPLAEMSLELDHGARGWLLHEVLADLHRRLNEKHGGPTAAGSIGQDALKQFFVETLAACVAKLRAEDPLSAALVELDRRTLTEWGGKYAAQVESYDKANASLDKPFAPAHFEVAFGPDISEDEIDKLSMQKPFVLRHGDEAIKLLGRIDRIDIGRAGGSVVFNVLDYKSGKSAGLRPSDIEKGLALQLPLYAIVAQEMLLAADHAEPWQFGYWFVKEKGFSTKGAITANKAEGGALTPDAGWIALKQKVVERVVSIVRGVRHAEFPMHSQNDDCTSTCEFNTVCRVQQARALEKKWQPPSAT